MTVDGLEFLFKITLFIGIIYQVRSFFLHYVHGFLAEAHELSVQKTKSLKDSIALLEKKVTEKELALIHTAERLQELEGKIDVWHLAIQKEQRISAEKCFSLYNRYLHAIQEQMKEYAIEKNALERIQRIGSSALVELAQESPEILSLYTKKQLDILWKGALNQ